MVVRIAVHEPVESDWSAFFGVPHDQLLGLDGLWDASDYYLPAVLEIEINGVCIAPEQYRPTYYSLIPVAIGWDSLADNIARSGEATMYCFHGGPKFRLSVEGNALAMQSFHPGWNPDEEPLVSAECCFSEFKSETQRVSQDSLRLLRQRMREKGLERILDDWLMLSLLDTRNM